MQNILDACASQYANSPILLGLIERINAAIDPVNDINNFYNDIWNVDTATGYGLDVWGRIVGVSRVVQVANAAFFGFEDDSTGNASGDPFNVSPFYTGQPTTSNFALSDTAFRNLIYAKALTNISDGSVPSINQILMTLFPGLGNAYVTWSSPLHIVYNFTYALEPYQVAILHQTGVLPTPAGCSFSIAAPNV